MCLTRRTRSGFGHWRGHRISGDQARFASPSRHAHRGSPPAGTGQKLSSGWTGSARDGNKLSLQADAFGATQGDHLDCYRHRHDCVAGGLPRASGDSRSERVRVGVRRALSRQVRPAVDLSDGEQSEIDRGSAVAEFALVLVLLLMLFLALLSVGLWAYTRTLLTSAAADAARLAANYDASATVSTAQVSEMLGDGVTGATRSTLSCDSGLEGLLVTVRCRMQAPGIVGILDGVMPTIEVTGHSAKESIG